MPNRLKEMPPVPKDDANTPRPVWVRAAGAVYDILWYPDQAEFIATLKGKGSDQADDVTNAMTDHWGRDIHMGSWVTLDLQRENLFHEVMHAVHGQIKLDMSVFEGTGLDRHSDQIDWEEWFLSVLDAPLLSTLRDNPHVTRWILGGR